LDKELIPAPPSHRVGLAVVYGRHTVPSVKGSRSFSVAGRTVWNALPDYLRNPALSVDVFKRYLKTFLFAQY